MGNGEVERAMTLASRDLAAAGIDNPTPQQTEAALMGGTVTNAQGQSTDMQGVLQLRSQGMGWGQIANTIGVHPSQSERGAVNSMRGRDRGQAAGAGPAGTDDRFSRAQASLQSREVDRNPTVRDSARQAGSSAGGTIASARDHSRGASGAAGAQDHDSRSSGALSRSEDRRNDRAPVVARNANRGGANAGAESRAEAGTFSNSGPGNSGFGLNAGASAGAGADGSTGRGNGGGRGKR
ncbi:MAG TPA: hypothetical protein VFO57_04505 [Burkholderiales bacterium]|nr:hypothetical protein [Burkholderiales bacterium]